MATKQELLIEAQSLGVTLSGEETVAQIKELVVKARPGKKTTAKDLPPAVREPVANEPLDFSWAANIVKLNRAKAHVRGTLGNLKGKQFEEAVKERYLEIAGLLVSDKPLRGVKRAGAVQNMAENDGSPD